MSDQRSSETFRPFENLHKLMERSNTLAPNTSAPSPEEPQPRVKESPSDEDLFQQAMAGVKRLNGPRRVEKRCVSLKPIRRSEYQDQETYQKLKALVDSGEGFHVSQTAEYVEGAITAVHPSVLSRLHRGEFSVQDYIDLHGLCLAEAQEQFNAFLKHALAARRKGVLIVHGRGLSSPAEPVLKTHVLKWINSGAWRKWIIAYTSARLCDGGAGATYLLLRDRPMSPRPSQKPS